MGRQGAVPGHQQSPGVGGGKPDIVVFLHVGGLDEDSKIQQSFVQALRHIVGVAAVQVIADIGAGPLQAGGDFRYHSHGLGLAAADVDIAVHHFIRRGQLGFRLFYQIDDFRSPLAQEHSILREGDPAASADQQLFAQFLLQVHQLPGQGGLGHMQGLGGP